MKKIGILTFHCAHNYGAVLQCYALQETLKKLGYDVEIIDYRPKYIVNAYKIFNMHHFISRNPIKMAKKCFNEFLSIYMRIKRYYVFEKFINKKLKLSEYLINNEIPSKYDIYIIGSDQIWNPKITNNFDRIYFCQFKFNKGNRKYIAYAASMEAKKLSAYEKTYYRNNLKNFDTISVRENQLAELLQPLTSKKIFTVLDPTLLLTSTTWKKIIDRPILNKKYVLVYQVRYNKNTHIIAKNIAKQIGGIVVEISSDASFKMRRNLKQSASPIEFLNYIMNAAFVVTTSFHGTAFSIIFERPFYCIHLDDESDSRSYSLLSYLGLSDRMISFYDKPSLNNIQYKHTRNLLNKLQNESISLLKEISKYDI